MEENQNNLPPQEEGIDILALVRQLWNGRKSIIICTLVFMLLGLVAAITMKPVYTVSSVMVPQLASRSNSSLGSLAALAGVDLGMSSGGTEISPVIYPQIVRSIPFRKELMNAPVHYSKAPKPVSMYTYMTEYEKPTFFTYVKKYTIGLPGLLLSKLRKPQPPMEVLDGSSVGDSIPRPIVVTRAEAIVLGTVGENVTLSADKKEGYLTLSVTGTEPLQTAELAMVAQQLLQQEITRFRTEKAQDNLRYVEARYKEIKAETESLQAQLAAVRDRSQDMTTSQSRLQQERLQTKYNVSSAIYTEMAKQLEQSKMQVKRDTPNLTIIQPITMPNKPSNSRARILILWTFLGIVLGCGIVLGKEYWPKFKEMLQKDQKEDLE